MPNLLGKALATLALGSLQPATQPHDTANLTSLIKNEQRIAQPNQDLQQMHPLHARLDKIPTVPFPQLSKPAPYSIEIPPLPNHDIHPYGPSFMFNGVRVYVEPIAAASAVSEQPQSSAERFLVVSHPLPREPVAVAPANSSHP